MKKEYCVHVYESAKEFDDIHATSPSQAEQLVVNSQYAGDYSEIERIEVKRVHCSTDHDLDEKKCSECEANL